MMTGVGSASARVIDVTDIDPKYRHTIIFQLFEHLGSTDSLELVVDHNPRRLRFALEAAHGGQCQWTYLEEGPDTWRVRLRRLRGVGSDTEA